MGLSRRFCFSTLLISCPSPHHWLPLSLSTLSPGPALTGPLPHGGPHPVFPVPFTLFFYSHLLPRCLNKTPSGSPFLPSSPSILILTIPCGPHTVLYHTSLFFITSIAITPLPFISFWFNVPFIGGLPLPSPSKKNTTQIMFTEHSLSVRGCSKGFLYVILRFYNFMSWV